MPTRPTLLVVAFCALAGACGAREPHGGDTTGGTVQREDTAANELRRAIDEIEREIALCNRGDESQCAAIALQMPRLRLLASLALVQPEALGPIRDPAIPQTAEELSQYLEMIEHCMVNGDPRDTTPQERWEWCMMSVTWGDECGIDD